MKFISSKRTSVDFILPCDRVLKYRLCGSPSEAMVAHSRPTARANRKGSLAISDLNRLLARGCGLLTPLLPPAALTMLG
jgi:hypothetical protein